MIGYPWIPWILHDVFLYLVQRFLRVPCAAVKFGAWLGQHGSLPFGKGSRLCKYLNGQQTLLRTPMLARYFSTSTASGVWGSTCIKARACGDSETVFVEISIRHSRRLATPESLQSLFSVHYYALEAENWPLWELHPSNRWSIGNSKFETQIKL